MEASDSASVSTASSVAKVFRFKFSEDVMDKMNHFSNVHQHDDRQTFKEEWEKWAKDNESMINAEKVRLEEMGYNKDINVKMFKSMRYYLRRKINGTLSSATSVVSDPVQYTQDGENQQKRRYISLKKELLGKMSEHVAEHIEDEDYSPSKGFNDFKHQNETDIANEVTRIVEQHNMTEDQVIAKIKKTYKNRYYVATH